jgi:hypothetical protein
MKTRSQTRREFCATACRGASVAALAGGLGALLEGCGGGNPTGPSANATPLPVVTGDATSNAVTVSVAAGSTLAAAGAMALVQTAIGDLLVAHTSTAARSARVRPPVRRQPRPPAPSVRRVSSMRAPSR